MKATAEKQKRERAEAYLNSALARVRIALTKATMRRGCTETEIANLNKKVATLEWLLEMIHERKQEDQAHQVEGKDH